MISDPQRPNPVDDMSDNQHKHAHSGIGSEENLEDKHINKVQFYDGELIDDIPLTQQKNSSSPLPDSQLIL